MTAGTVRGLCAAMVLALALTGCRGDLPAHAATCDNTAALVLMAQAVPSARSIPCFEEVPFAFATTTLDIEAGSVEIGLSHAVVGLDAAVMTITRGCAPDQEGTAVTAPPLGELFAETIQPEEGHVTGRLVQGLGGACLVVDLAMPHPAGERALEDLQGSWRLMDRDELRRRLAEETDGRLRLP